MKLRSREHLFKYVRTPGATIRQLVYQSLSAPKRMIERPDGAEHSLYPYPGRRYALAWATGVRALRAALQPLS